jgi:ElaB/YqjD/DUF883 family membrane-anchored ribosome-binding protein
MNTTIGSKADAKTRDDVEAIAAEIARLRNDLSSLVETVGRVGRRRAEGLADTAADKAGEKLAAGEAMLADLVGELERVERDMVAATRRNPWRSLSIAAAIGFLLAMILRR